MIGGYPLDVLQEHVVKSFSDIPTKGIEASWDIIPESPFRDIGMPFADSSLCKIYYSAPVKDLHALSVTWQLPPQLGNWKSKPCDYVSHLIGHEAQGSLLAALKSKGWATACCAGVGGEGFEVRNRLVVFQYFTHLVQPRELFASRMRRHMLSLAFLSRYPKKVSLIGVKLFP